MLYEVITDADGDTTTATFQVRLTDEGPSIDPAPATIAVDEDDIPAPPAGNPDGPGDLAASSYTQSGVLTGLDFGTDGPGDLVLSTSGDIGFNTLAGNAIETLWDGASHTLTGQDSVTGDDVFTLQITDVNTGARTFTLLAPVQHTVSSTEDDKSFNVTVTVTDAEGESRITSYNVCYTKLLRRWGTCRQWRLSDPTIDSAAIWSTLPLRAPSSST